MLSIINRRGRARQLALGAGIMVAMWAWDNARADGPWCASVQGPDGGAVSCSYTTWRQCMASLGGVGGVCHLNPASGVLSGWDDRPPSRIVGSPGTAAGVVPRP
jgi:hypothetical protein